jgi:hypothetical protein
LAVSDSREESHSTVSLLVINVDRKTIRGPNETFNLAVAICDTNKDGIITEQEAEIFASSSKSLVPKKE